MKKLLLLPLLMLISSVIIAQISWGVQAGANFAFVKEEYTDSETGITETFKYNTRFGFTAGAVAEIPVSRSLTLRPEVNFLQKNYNSNVYVWDSYVKTDFIQNYLELPVNLVYNKELSFGRFFFGGGPSLAIGLSGKVKFDDLSLDIVFDGSDNATATDDNLHLKPIELGFGLIAGQSFPNGLFTSVGFNFGITNILPEPDINIDLESDTDKMRTKGLTVKIGYMIPSVKSKK